jgi:hypothetical protein
MWKQSRSLILYRAIWPDELVASVETPGNAVEFELEFGALALAVEGEVVEALNLQARGSNN